MQSELSQGAILVKSLFRTAARLAALLRKRTRAPDVLDTELEHAAGIPLRWYDVLVQLEESPQGIPMNTLAERILYSKSGFTRVIHRMEEAGLVRRLRPQHDRRTILIFLTDKGTKRWNTPAATTAKESNATSPNTSPKPTSRHSPAPLKNQHPRRPTPPRTHPQLAPPSQPPSGVDSPHRGRPQIPPLAAFRWPLSPTPLTA